MLSALPTITALAASAATVLPGQPITLTATVTSLTPGGATPNGGIVTLTDQYGPIASAPVVHGVVRFITARLPAGTHAFSASYRGTAAFAPSHTGTIFTALDLGPGPVIAPTVGAPATVIRPDAPAKVMPAAPDAVGVAYDAAGNLFVADQPHNQVREIVKATGQSRIVAGNGTAGYSGDGGPATAAALDAPLGLAADAAGNLFIADVGNDVIREVVHSTGAIVTYAGNGTPGYGGDGGPATDASLGNLDGLAVDSAGNLFLSDEGADVIREVIRSNGTIGTIITVAGNGAQGFLGYNGPATAASMELPLDVADDPAGNLFITASGNNQILGVSKATGDIYVVAGMGPPLYAGDNGPALDAYLSKPAALALDSVGNIFIADQGNNVVREVVKATGAILTVAGNGTAGDTGEGGPATGANLDNITGVAIDAAGHLVIADGNNNVVRETTPPVIVAVEPDATVTSIRASAGSTVPGAPVTFTATVSNLTPGEPVPTGGLVTFRDQNGTLAARPLIRGVATFTTSRLAQSTHVVTASYGGSPDFKPSTTGILAIFAGLGTSGYTGDNGPATVAELAWPSDVAVDRAGNVFIADGTNVVREVVKATGKIITVAGNGTAGYSGDGGPATAATLNLVSGLALDIAGNLFISDCNNNVVREVVKATGTIITVAGNGNAGYSGDDGPATAATMALPSGVAVDAAGNLFITDSGNNAVREVVKATGQIVTLAAATGLNCPGNLCLDSKGNVFIADSNNNVVREVVAATGTMVTVAGDGSAGYRGDYGLATAAALNNPEGVYVDSPGDLFIADMGNHVVREVVAGTGQILTVVAGSAAPAPSKGKTPNPSSLVSPAGVAVDADGRLFIADNYNSTVLVATPAAVVNIAPPLHPRVVSATSITMYETIVSGDRTIQVPVLGGILLVFNESLGPAARNPSNYRISEAVRIGRKLVQRPVACHLAYDESTHTISLLLAASDHTFTTGGTLTLKASKIVDLTGHRLVGRSVFRISPGGTFLGV